MEHEVRNGERICIGFEEEYRKYVSGEESKIFREIRHNGRRTLYSVYDTTGGMFSCTQDGVLPTPPQFVLGYKGPKIRIEAS